MRWLYLLLAIGASIFGIMAAIFVPMELREKNLPIFVSAAVVNFGLFFTITWAKRRKAKDDDDAGRPQADSSMRE
jgi:cytochrome bd-type quinol oxidase subunit 2